MNGPARLAGAHGPGAWAYCALALHSGRPLPGGARLGTRRRVVVLRSDEEALEDVSDCVRALAPLFPELHAPAEAFFGDDAERRSASLSLLHAGAGLVYVNERALACPVPSSSEYARRRVLLRPQAVCPRARLLAALSAEGYRRVDYAQDGGDWAARGGVVDFIPWRGRPVRVLYDADQVASLRAFDPGTQAGAEPLSEACVEPAADGGERVLEASLEDAFWLAEPGGLGMRLGLELEGAPGEGSDLGTRPAPSFRGDIPALAAQCRRWEREGIRTALFSRNRGESERLQELLEGRVEGSGPQFLVGTLSEGFLSPSLGWALLGGRELFGRSWRPARPAAPYAGPRARWRELKPGDYVVHAAYGVARYLGLESVETGEGPSRARVDCLKLEFRGSDKLFVPMTDFKKIQKYVGAEGRRPRLCALDSRRWEDVRERVREGVRDLAQKLLRLEAERAARSAAVFGPPTHLEREFADAFPYEETPDQRRAIEEVLSDMEKPRAMDRLVVGDVGFGKTEVAMRAALKCAAGGCQTAVLVPTTVLADQHERNFRARFAEYPVRVETLSRLKPPAEQRRVLKALAEGAVDIVIGTHRLLQKGVRFKKLGLLVIDEEHRFGVRDKERLKELRRDVHCLALSATPIPRTLYQALSGLRGLSSIQSAPAGRQGVETAVLPFSEAHAARAIEAELARGGQAYFVHNRVRTLGERLRSLRALLPGARLDMAHGQMPPREIERVMWEFSQGRLDVLVASSIIESGLDIPSVNTLLVEDAQDFGLSQLYQLRGRIGRERRKAYCYLYAPPGNAALEGEAAERLKALREFGSLGSGYALAMRDLEIRGAGDLLGPKQHGFLNAVGLEAYCDLLRGEVERLAGRARAIEAPKPQLDLRVSAYLPPDYFPGDMERLEFYKRLLAADERGLESLRAELEDLCGPEPGPVATLLRLLRVRAASAGLLRAVVERPGSLDVFFFPKTRLPQGTVEGWLRRYGERSRFLRSSEGDGLRVPLEGTDALSWLERFMEGLGPSAR